MSINHVGIIGAGQMGTGIAQVFLTSSFKVTLIDQDLNSLEKAALQIKKNIYKMQQKGLITEADYMKNLDICYEISDLKFCDLVVEAIVEDYYIKKTIYRKLEDILENPHAVICSNTSSFSIKALSEDLDRPEQFLGLHFMNPAPIIGLVEIIKGEKTSEEVMCVMQKVCKLLKKEVVICPDSPGFIVNRVLIPMINEACFLLGEGKTTPENIDQAMKFGANFPIGPLALADLIGLDIVFAIMDTLYNELGAKFKPAPILEQYVQSGRLGKKTGNGFFKY